MISATGTPPVSQQPHDYGAANKFGFDDPNKWVTVPNVPLLDEHVMTGEDGRDLAQVDRSVLEEIARNNNRKVYETGDPATLILGHTSDDPRAPEKPAVGFVTGLKVKPFRRDPESGKMIYAIFGDYKIRPKNAHLVDDFPRRSVELWWHKRDIDPVAMLGGSSPERDLGAVIRHGRINHVSMAVSPRRDGVRGSSPYSCEEVIRFSRRGNHVIETYSISPPVRYSGDKVHKVMSEFKNGTLHSGSKHGPKVTSRDQAVAIAMNEAGKSKYSEGSDMGPDRYNADCGTNGKMQYDDGSMDTHDLPDEGDYDPGDDGTPDGDLDGSVDGGDEQDPTVAKVLQSRQFKQLSADMSEIKGMLTQLMGGGAGGPPGGEPGMGEDPVAGEMPPPGAGAPPMGGPMDAPGGDPGMDAPGGEPGVGGPMEEESRRGMGERPVQMSGTAFPGASDVNVPTYGGKSSYSRNGKSNMNGARTQQRGRQAPAPVNNPQMAQLQAEVVRLKRQSQEDRIRYARVEAEKIVSTLEAEGIQFGDTPEIAARVKADRISDLTSELLFDQDSAGTRQPTQYAKDHVAEIRTCYKRRRPDPARPSAPSLTQFSRAAVDITGQKPGENADEETFEDRLTDSQTVEFANILAKGAPRAEAIKFMRKRYGV